MTTAMTNIPSAPSEQNAGFFNFFGRFWDKLCAMGENDARWKKIQCLNAMSDEELTKIKLRREDIAMYVFRDIMYL